MLLVFLITTIIFSTYCFSFNYKHFKSFQKTVRYFAIETPNGGNIEQKESPLVDRALDSALDFLQDAERVADEEDDEFDMFEIYEESPDFEVPYDLISELEEKEVAAINNKLPSASDLNRANIKSALEKWRQHENDCGSAEVQVVIANERIKYLTKHLLANKKDVAAKRGLDALVNTRRKFLNYLYATNNAKALQMISELKIRFRPPGRLWDKEAKYGAFKNTKTVMKKQQVNEKV